MQSTVREAHLDRSHRPAARSGPKRLAMGEGAEPLRRSPGLARLEGPVTPETMLRLSTIRNYSPISNFCREHDRSIIHNRVPNHNCARANSEQEYWSR